MLPVAPLPLKSAFGTPLPAPHSPNPSPPCPHPPPEAAPLPTHALPSQPDAATCLRPAARGSAQTGTPSRRASACAPSRTHDPLYHQTSKEKEKEMEQANSLAAKTTMPRKAASGLADFHLDGKNFGRLLFILESNKNQEEGACSFCAHSHTRDPLHHTCLRASERTDRYQVPFPINHGGQKICIFDTGPISRSKK